MTIHVTKYNACYEKCKVKVDVTQYYACHANDRGDRGVKWDPSTSPEPAQCHMRHACHAKWVSGVWGSCVCVCACVWVCGCV